MGYPMVAIAHKVAMQVLQVTVYPNESPFWGAPLQSNGENHVRHWNFRQGIGLNKNL